MKCLFGISILLVMLASVAGGWPWWHKRHRNRDSECRPGDLKYETAPPCFCTIYGIWACGSKIGSRRFYLKKAKNGASNELTYKCYEQQQVNSFRICYAKALRYELFTLGGETVWQIPFLITDCRIVSVRLPLTKCPESDDEIIVDEKEFLPTPEVPSLVPPKITKKPETTTSPSVETPPEVEDSGDTFTEDDLESEDFECKPNKSFKLACNTCWCRADGQGPKYCTRIACNPKTYKPLTQQDSGFLDSVTEPMSHHS